MSEIKASCVVHEWTDKWGNGQDLRYRVVVHPPSTERSPVVEFLTTDAMGADSWHATGAEFREAFGRLAECLLHAQRTIDELSEIDECFHDYLLAGLIPDQPTASDIRAELRRLRDTTIADARNNQNAFFDSYPALDALLDRMARL